MAKPLFRLKEIYFSYLGKIPALCGIDLAIEEGSKLAIIGANGSGKSTLLSLLDALIFPDQGAIEFFGQELKEDLFNSLQFSRDFRRRVGFVFQNPDVQLFCPTVKEEIVFGPLQLEIARGEIDRRLKRLADIFKLTHLLERSSHQLSIGEKKKVALASVLAIEPEVLLLDEPTAGLDPQTTRDIIDIVLDEDKADKTIIIATQDLHLVSEVASVVHVFGPGKNIIRSSSSAEVLADQQFLEENNLMHLHRHQHKDKAHIHAHLHQEHHL